MRKVVYTIGLLVAILGLAPICYGRGVRVPGQGWAVNALADIDKELWRMIKIVPERFQGRSQKEKVKVEDRIPEDMWNVRVYEILNRRAVVPMDIRTKSGINNDKDFNAGVLCETPEGGVKPCFVLRKLEKVKQEQ